MNILEKIVAKITEQEESKWNKFDIENENRSLEDIANDIKRKNSREINRLPEGFTIIAEMKKASPSAGVIIEDYNPLDIAKIYDDEDIKAYSILTEKDSFMGHLEHLSLVRERYKSKLLLRKDFMVHRYQIFEAYEYGADMILLIVAILSDEKLKELYDVAVSLSLNILIEVHNEDELNRVLKNSFKKALIGINNRDLKTLKVDINNSFKLKKMIPDEHKVVAESGFKEMSDIRRLKEENFYAILIGHSILSSSDIKSFLKEIREI